MSRCTRLKSASAARTGLPGFFTYWIQELGFILYLLSGAVFYPIYYYICHGCLDYNGQLNYYVCYDNIGLEVIVIKGTGT